MRYPRATSTSPIRAWHWIIVTALVLLLLRAIFGGRPAWGLGRDNGATIAGLRAFQARVSEVLEPVVTSERAIRYLKLFRMSADARPLSERSDAEIEAFLSVNGEDPLPEIENPRRAQRASYSDSELGELLALSARKREGLSFAQARVFQEIDRSRALLEEAAQFSSRYDVLLELRDAEKLPRARALDAIQGALSRAALPRESVPAKIVELIYPYAIEAWEGMDFRSGHELDALRPEESPIFLAERAERELGGSADDMTRALALYRSFRDHMPPTPALSPASGPDLARVAMIDSGVDFIRYPEIGRILARGSFDFADGNENPWSPFWKGFDHGTRTAHSLLTVFAGLKGSSSGPGLALSIWKVSSLRETLSGQDDEGLHDWSLWPAAQAAVIRNIENARTDNAPKVVSVSMGIPLFDALKALHRESLLLSAPWLWVMAAGNERSDSLSAKAASPACFDDVPASVRPDGRILCVGALASGSEAAPKIAFYSNFGPRVDVYAYESNDPLCTDGTSCATPAVAATAAYIEQKIPGIAPEKIKEAILNASELRPLGQDAFLGTGARGRSGSVIEGRVFDPLTMSGRALAEAEKLSH